MSFNYSIAKYKPLISFNPFKHRDKSIYSIMDGRNYELFTSIIVNENEKIKSYKKFIDNNLTVMKADDTYYYVYYISYPKAIIREKEVLIFRKPIHLEYDSCIIDEKKNK